jgi:trigger factor
MRVEVEVAQVEEAFTKVTKDYQRRVNLPGFRPGHVPLPMILRRFQEEITKATKEKLITDSYKQAVDEQKLDVLGQPDIEEIQFARGQPLQFAATLETAPEFPLPEYKGLPARIESRTVTEGDLERALQALREPRAEFKTVDRPLHSNDIAVANYTGTCDAKPITELAPSAKGLAERKNFWIEIGSDQFIPGFAEQLLGAKAGDKRTVTVDFPPDFGTPQLAGKRGVYEVEVVEVKEKALPALDEAFAKAYGAEGLEKLREGVRRDLENQLTYFRNRSIRRQVLEALVQRAGNFDLPAAILERTTRNVVDDIVGEHSKRGASREQIEEHKEQIFAVAAQDARGRLKLSFLLQKIAEKENIGVSNEEIGARVAQIAVRHKIPPQKLAKDLQKRNGLIQIYDEIMNEKVMEFLQQHAALEAVPPGTLSPSGNPS